MRRLPCLAAAPVVLISSSLRLISAAVSSVLVTVASGSNPHRRARISSLSRPRQNRRLMSDDFRELKKCSKGADDQLAPAEPCAAAKLRCAGARVM